MEASCRKLVKNPDVALIPFVFDALALALVLALIVTVGAEPSLSLGELVRPNFQADVPKALPSVEYVGDPVGVLFDTAPAHLAAVAVALLASVPIRAYGTAGFVGVLYHRVHKDLGPQARSFFHYAKRFYVPLFFLELAFALLFIPGLYIFLVSEVGAILYAAAATVAFALLVFAPYAVVADGLDVLPAIERSVRTFFANLRTCLPMVAVALLLTGGFAFVARQLIASQGTWGYLLAGLLFSPVGAVLSLFFLSVYIKLRGSPYVGPAHRTAYIG